MVGAAFFFSLTSAFVKTLGDQLEAFPRIGRIVPEMEGEVFEDTRSLSLLPSFPPLEHYARARSPLSPPEERPRRAMRRQSALVFASAHAPKRLALM